MPRRNGRKRTKRRRRKTKVPMPIGGFSNTKMVRLRKVFEHSLNAGADGYSYALFRANGLNFISNTSTPARPSNFLLHCNAYERYVVLGAKITTTFVPTGNDSNTKFGYMGVYLGHTEASINTILAQGIGRLMEQKEAIRTRKVAGNEYGKPVSITHTFSPSKFFGKTKQYIKTSNDYVGTAAADPSEPNLAYFSPFIKSINNNDPDNCVLISQIDYIVMFQELKPQGN
jgi:hypothetical protein